MSNNTYHGEVAPCIQISEMRPLWKHARLICSYDVYLLFYNVFHLLLTERIQTIIIKKLQVRNQMLQDELVRLKNVNSN